MHEANGTTEPGWNRPAGRPLAARVPGVIFQLRRDPDGRSCLVYASDGLVDMFGVTPAQAALDASAIWDRVLPDDRAAVVQGLQASAQSLGAWQCEFRVTWPAQAVRWCCGDAIPERQDDGSVLWSGFITDITQRKVHEAALQAANAEVNDLYNQAPCGYHSLDANGMLVRINDTELQWLGYTRDELVGKVRMRDLMTPTSQALFRQTFSQFLARGWLHDVDIELVRKDGSVLPVRVDATAVKDADGQFVMSRSVVYDMSERRQADKVQARLNRALQLLSRCNMTLVHSTDEAALLGAICQLVVEVGSYRMAWIGYADNDEHQSVRPVAEHGFDDDYLRTASITWADNERGRGPTGTAIREGRTQVNQNFLTNPKMLPWRAAAVARGYQSSIALPLKFGDAQGGALMLYAAEPDAFSDDEVRLLEELAADLAFGIANLRMREEHDRSEVRLRDSLEGTIQAIGATLEMRDPYTAGHQRRVALLAQELAREMGLKDERVHALGLAASIHDLGKIRIPAEILTKPGRLTPLEYSIIQKHAQAGFDILQHIAFPWPIARWIRQHHERLDGSGYPQGLRGGDLDLESRILAVADVIEAISSHRPYRAGLGIETALQEVVDHKGVLYDAAVVDACVRLFRDRHYAMPT